MKKTILAATLALALFGCRRADVRTVTIEIPDLAPANRQQVVDALSKYNGVEKDSFKWDFQAKTVTLAYDSLQVAQTNLRMAIEAKGLTVVYPPNTTGRAGY